MNIEERLRAASRALKESSIAQVDATSRLREIVRHTDQSVVHGRSAVLLDEPRESRRSLASSLPVSGKASAAPAGRSAAATPTSHWTDGEARSTFDSQSPTGNAVGRLLGSIWRYKGLIAAAVLLGALLGSGWAARQPTLYEGVTRVWVTAGSTSLPGDVLPQPPVDPGRYLDNQAQLLSSPVVLQRAVKLTRNRISAETLRQRLEVDAAKDADLLTIRVVDSTATGAAQLADAVAVAYDQVLAQQWHESFRAKVRQLQSLQSALGARLAEMDAKLARDSNDSRLRAQRAAVAEQLSAIARQLMESERYPSLSRERAAVPGQPISPGPGRRERAAVPRQPISPRPGRAMVIGMLLGLLASAVLVWWRTRGQWPTSTSSATEQGPEMPRA